MILVESHWFFKVKVFTWKNTKQEILFGFTPFSLFTLYLEFKGV